MAEKKEYEGIVIEEFTILRGKKVKVYKVGSTFKTESKDVLDFYINEYKLKLKDGI